MADDTLLNEIISNQCPIRIKLILSLLSGKPIKMKHIRSDDDEPGLKNFEVNLLKLIDAITNGTRTDINETGTSLYFVPGLLIGGKLTFDCQLERAIGYYLQVIACLAPFAKQPMDVTLTGVTNDPFDVSVDMFKYTALPVLKRFLGSDDGLELKLSKRGAKPDGGGQCHFRCPTKMKLVPVNLTDPGKIKRIRGMAYAMRVAPAICNRMVETAKGVLLKLLPDVYIISDHQRGDNAGKSPAFGLTLVAETINGTFLCGEACSLPKGSVELRQQPSVPEDVALRATHNLLEEIYRGGCLDSSQQHLACLFMALNQKDVSRVVSGILTPFTVHFMRELRTFFELKFKIEPCRNQDVDVTYKRLLDEKEAEEENSRKKKKLKRNLQLPQEIQDDELKKTEEEMEKEEEKARTKAKLEEEEKSVKEYLKLGHEKLLVSCIGIGYSNITKTFV